MDNKEPQIKISDPYLEGVKVVQEQIKDIKNSFKWSTTFVIGVLALGFITLLFMVATILIDAWHFNSTIYKENKVLELNSAIVQNDFNQQQDIIKRLEKIESKIKNTR